MGGFSIWLILIFGLFLLLLFGGNRFSAMMGDVAKGMKSFKEGMADERRRSAALCRAAQADRASCRATAADRRHAAPPAEPAAPPPPRDDEAR